MTRLIDLKEDYLFWPGTVLRKFNVGLNTTDINENYYDYILAHANWESDSIMLVNITLGFGKNKAGSVYGGLIKIDQNGGKIAAKKSALKKCLDDFDNWYLID